MINIVFNGEDRTVESAVLETCLNEVRTDKRPCAVAVNQAFVPKNEYASTLLKDGDRVELLVPMQGRKLSHEPVSPEEFRERVRQLASGKGKPKAASRKKAARTSPAAKKKAQLKKKSQASTNKKLGTVRGS